MFQRGDEVRIDPNADCDKQRFEHIAVHKWQPEGTKLFVLEPKNVNGYVRVIEHNLDSTPQERYIAEDILEFYPMRLAIGSVRDIAEERLRQVKKHGYTSDIDDTYREQQLARAAACYLTPPGQSGHDRSPIDWPWDHIHWKPGARRRELVKAGALIAAEIDRLDRIEQRKPPTWNGFRYFVPLGGHFWAGEIVEVEHVDRQAGKQDRVTGKLLGSTSLSTSVFDGSTITPVSTSAVERVRDPLD